MTMYTNNGRDFVKKGCHLVIGDQHRYFCTENDLKSLGYYPYKIVEGDGTDGVVNDEWVHYVPAANNDEQWEEEQ